MTEAEWEESDNHDKMLLFLATRNLRKCRLFACATCRRIGHLISDAGLNVLAVAERFADGQITKEELIGVEAKAPGWSMGFGKTQGAGSAVSFTTNLQEAMPLAYGSKESLVGCLFAHKWAAVETDDVPAEWQVQAHLLRDIFGNPFRSSAVAPSWLTSTVLALASQMYESRDFAPMPILADALQDAGCDNDDILNHCRQSGEHTKGCWVVDLLLGKE
jgi:hypothetical protein